jgi:hypothetical protein
MAFGTNSKIFRNFISDAFQQVSTAPGTGIDLDTDVPKVAIYGNTGTPDQNATAVLSAYNGAASAWVTANELTDANWPAGGRPLVSGAPNSATAGLYWYDAADTAGAGNVTIANAYGVLVYDDTITTPQADIGMSFHAFATQPAGVTAGTFTVVWDVLGLFRYTL